MPLPPSVAIVEIDLAGGNTYRRSAGRPGQNEFTVNGCLSFPLETMLVELPGWFGSHGRASTLP